jgi:hypothetical protein
MDHGNMSNKSTISADSRAAVEQLAFERYLSVLQVAYERDGLVGALQASAAVVGEYDQLAAAAENEGSRELARAIAATALATDTLPAFSKAFAEV